MEKDVKCSCGSKEVEVKITDTNGKIIYMCYDCFEDYK
jgi:hypothetical protein